MREPNWDAIQAAALDGDSEAVRIMDAVADWTRAVCSRVGPDWYKPEPRPADHKYECQRCGYYDLNDYE